MKREVQLAVTGISFLSFTAFLFSLGARSDPVPQGFSLMLVPFFLGAVLIRHDIRLRLIALLLFLPILSSHMLTSFIVVLVVFAFVPLFGKESLLSLPALACVLWFSWVTYVGVYQLSGGINFVVDVFRLESSFELVTAKATGTVGSSVLDIETYLLYRRLTLALVYMRHLTSIG